MLNLLKIHKNKLKLNKRIKIVKLYYVSYK